VEQLCLIRGRWWIEQVGWIISFRYIVSKVFWRPSTKMVGLMFLLVVFSSVPQQCSRAVRSIKGMYLSGHVMPNGSADGVDDCLIDCSFHPRCKSINFRFKDLLCELNGGADRHTHPWDYGWCREGHAYSDYPFKRWLLKSFTWRLMARDTCVLHLTANQITFNAGSIKHALLLRIPLVKVGILERWNSADRWNNSS